MHSLQNISQFTYFGIFLIFLHFRRGCGNCKCPIWKHDVPQSSSGHPFERIGVEEKQAPLNSEYDKALTEGYTWVPRGLRSSQVRKSVYLFTSIPKAVLQYDSISICFIWTKQSSQHPEKIDTFCTLHIMDE